MLGLLEELYRLVPWLVAASGPALILILGAVAAQKISTRWVMRRDRLSAERQAEVAGEAAKTIDELPRDPARPYLRPIALSRESITVPSQSDIDEQLAPLRERLAEIERRFPGEATLEKVASVNDAILATSLENLAASVARLEKSALTKWDVVTVNFMVLAALATLATIAGFAVMVLRSP